MKRIFIILLNIVTLLPIYAQNFSKHFADSTLRLDYIFAGDSSSQHIYLDELSMSPRWYGRRQRLSELPLKGNGSISTAGNQIRLGISQSFFHVQFHSITGLFRNALSQMFSPIAYAYGSR